MLGAWSLRSSKAGLRSPWQQRLSRGRVSIRGFEEMLHAVFGPKVGVPSQNWYQRFYYLVYFRTV